MLVNIKKLHPEAIVPSYAKPGDAGLDLTAVSEPTVVTSEEGYWYAEYKTGLAFEIPEGYVGLIFPRSSISKTVLSLANSVGVIDSGYRGEISFRFRTDSYACNEMLEDDVKPAIYKKGDKIGQIVIVPFPKVELQEVGELSSSERGTGGFGSTTTS